MQRLWLRVLPENTLLKVTCIGWCLFGSVFLEIEGKIGWCFPCLGVVVRPPFAAKVTWFVEGKGSEVATFDSALTLSSHFLRTVKFNLCASVCYKRTHQWRFQYSQCQHTRYVRFRSLSLSTGSAQVLKVSSDLSSHARSPVVFNSPNRAVIHTEAVYKLLVTLFGTRKPSHFLSFCGWSIWIFYWLNIWWTDETNLCLSKIHFVCTKQ